jgi:hypothetical protein
MDSLAHDFPKHDFPKSAHGSSRRCEARDFGKWARGVTDCPRPAKFEVRVVPDRLALTPPRHLQVINHRDCFSAFVSF